MSERAVLLSLGNTIDDGLNTRVMVLYQSLLLNNFTGFIEAVPAYASLAVFYDPVMAKLNVGSNETVFDFVKGFLENRCETLTGSGNAEAGRLIDIPVLYDGPDLDFIAMEKAMGIDEIVRLHTHAEYRVFMIGFLPGFPYLGTVDDAIAMPRRSTPRTTVAAGSVGIAGNQTGIYPQRSPGGWQLIGRTPKKIFIPEQSSPCLFQPGDRVRFYAITASQFAAEDEY